MKVLEITFRLYDTAQSDKRSRSLVIKHQLSLTEVSNNAVPFKLRAMEYAAKFWESIVLMGYLEK